jgi:hypothetical protein
MVIVEPSFLAPTTTPPIAPSLSELTCPLSATPEEFAPLVNRGAKTNEMTATSVMPTIAIFDIRPHLEFRLGAEFLR